MQTAEQICAETYRLASFFDADWDRYALASAHVRLLPFLSLLSAGLRTAAIVRSPAFNTQSYQQLISKRNASLEQQQQQQ